MGPGSCSERDGAHKHPAVDTVLVDADPLAARRAFARATRAIASLGGLITELVVEVIFPSFVFFVSFVA